MYRIIPFRPIKEKIIESNWRLKTLATSDLIGDIRGGDSFSDIYGLKNLVMGSIPDIIILLLGKNLALLPQTYGPYQSKISKCIAKFIIRRASFIVSRDRESIETVNKLLDKSDKKKVSYFCPDVAFVLDLFKENKIKINPPLNKSDNISIIGFNISGLLYSGGFSRKNMFGLKSDYKEFVHRLSEHILKETAAHLLLIPHTIAPPGNVESDPGACQEVFENFSGSYHNRIHIPFGENDQSSMKGIIGLCDFFVGSRMHSCIAALSQGIPTIAIAYSKKFHGVFDSVDAADLVVDARINDIENTIKYIMEFYVDRERISTTLNKQIQNAKLRTDEVFRLILH
jgi:polysaccharide pyruvyl transferase WcaK-like protein